MSNTDSFIDEVTEEVRRDRLFGLLRRYGWIAVLAVVLIVGAAAVSEYRKATARTQAEGLGDAMLAALSDPDAAKRAAGLAELDAHSAGTRAALALLTASEAVLAGDVDGAAAQLDALAQDAAVPLIYRQIAGFKSATAQAGSLSNAALRDRFQDLSAPGAPLRLLAQEQLALLEVASGETPAAIERLQSILTDAEVRADLQQRALQLIVALGGVPKIENMAQPIN